MFYKSLSHMNGFSNNIKWYAFQTAYVPRQCYILNSRIPFIDIILVLYGVYRELYSSTCIRKHN